MEINKSLLLHLVGLSILFTYIDDARSKTNQINKSTFKARASVQFSRCSAHGPDERHSRFFSSPNLPYRLRGPTSLLSMSSFPGHKVAETSTAEKKNIRNNATTPLRLHGLVNNYAQELYFNHISGIQDFSQTSYNKRCSYTMKEDRRYA